MLYLNWKKKKDQRIQHKKRCDINPWSVHKDAIQNTIHHRYKLRLKLNITKLIQYICVVPNLIQLKALISKIFSVSQARSPLERSFLCFVAAYSNVDWPVAVLYLGRWTSLLSLRALWRSQLWSRCEIPLMLPGTVIIINISYIYSHLMLTKFGIARRCTERGPLWPKYRQNWLTVFHELKSRFICSTKRPYKAHYQNTEKYPT